MIVKLLTEHLLDFLNLKEGCRGSSESTHVKMPHCWKSHAAAQILKVSWYIYRICVGRAHQNVLKRSYGVILRFIKIVLFIFAMPTMATKHHVLDHVQAHYRCVKKYKQNVNKLENK